MLSAQAFRAVSWRVSSGLHTSAIPRYRFAWRPPDAAISRASRPPGLNTLPTGEGRSRSAQPTRSESASRQPARRDRGEGSRLSEALFTHAQHTTSVRITVVFHDVEKGRTVVEVDAGMKALSAEGGNLQIRALSRRALAVQRLAQGIFDDGRQRSAVRGGDSLGLSQKMRIEPYGGSHVSRNITTGHQNVTEAGCEGGQWGQTKALLVLCGGWRPRPPPAL